MRSRVGFLVTVLVMAGLFGGVTATSVAAATKPTVTWRYTHIPAGESGPIDLLATTNSSGVKTWSVEGSCKLTFQDAATVIQPQAIFKMGSGGLCSVTLKIAKKGKFSAITSNTRIYPGPLTTPFTTTVTWEVSSLTAGQVKSLSAVASTNSPGVKTWSKTGSCVLSTKSNPPKLTMGTGGSCTLTLKIAKTDYYTAKTSTKTITRMSTTTTTAPATTTAPGGGSPGSDWLGCYFKGTKMAGAVYITDYSWSADFTVYITDYSWLADLTVYQTPYSWLATSCGVWYLTPYSWAADFTIYITDYSWSADLEVYVTPYSWAAGR